MDQQERALGELRREATGWIVRFERRFPRDRDTVWRAITRSEHLVHWLPCDIVGPRHAGAAIELPFWASHVERYGIETPTLRGEIRTWDPPSVFEWTWDTDVLRWELDEVDGGTGLTFTTCLAPDDEDAVRTASGYHVCLDHLEQLLEGNTSLRLVDADTAPIERRYLDRAGRPPGCGYLGLDISVGAPVQLGMCLTVRPRGHLSPRCSRRCPTRHAWPWSNG